jgi:translation elongation factor P/translation initiation factor 5A
MKARITGKCIFTGAKQDNFFIGKEILQSPDIKKSTYQLSTIDQEEGLKYFDEEDEIMTLPLVHPDKSVANFLAENKQLVSLQEAYEEDEEAALDFSVTIISSYVSINGKPYVVDMLLEWKSTPAE